VCCSPATFTITTFELSRTVQYWDWESATGSVGRSHKRTKSVKKNALLFRGTHFGRGCRNRVVVGLLKALRSFTFDHGQVVEDGTHEALVRKLGGTYKRLFEKQALGLVADQELEYRTADD
jgi:hypothetical protein